MTATAPPLPILPPSPFFCCSLPPLQLPATPTVEYVWYETPAHFLAQTNKRPDSVSWWRGVEGEDRKDAEDRGGGGDEHAGRGMWFLSALLSGVKSTENH